MKKKISILLFTMIAAVCSAQSQEYSFSEKYNVEDLTELLIDVEDGNISVLPSNEPGIRVNFIAKKNQKLIKFERADLEKYFTIEVTKTKNSISSLAIQIRKGNNKRWSNGIDLTLEIMVPNTTPCNLYTADGYISVKDLKANQKCKTGDGDIYFRDIEGELIAISGDGDVRGSLSVLKEDITIETFDGDIKVSIPEGLSLNLDLRADDIDTQFKDFIGRIGDDYIKGELRGGGISVNISTLDGDLRLDFE